VFPKTWPNDREKRARIIGEWLQRHARTKQAYDRFGRDIKYPSNKEAGIW
jgi:hypothetical protein